MEELYKVDGATIGRLSQSGAVEFLHKLLHAEATMVGGVDKSKINVPSAINVPDGGLDADVQDASPGTKSQGIIKRGRTSYQVKTGGFNVTNLSSAREIIQKDKIREFKPRVLSCFEDGGTLVVILFGSDNPDRVDDASVGFLRDAIREVDVQYENANIEVWHQNQIAGFLNPFPSLRATLQQASHNELLSVEQWSRRRTMINEMVIGEEQLELIESIREAVRADQNEPLRILGDPGVGKTRTALEAFKSEDLSPLVIYAEKPSAIPPGLLGRFLQPDNADHVILVVDECDARNRQIIWDVTSTISDRVKLVTIYNEQETTPVGMIQVNAEPLEESQIIEIFTSEEYGFPEDVARRYAQFCDGSPRVALIIANDVKLSGEVSINSHKDIWERYVRGGDDISSSELTKRITVLKWVALFKRFGYEAPYQHEAELIAAKIENTAHITAHDFRVIISDFRNRKILQGDATLYITPKLLHIWLWSQWWEEHGHSFDMAEFTSIDDGREMSPKLVDWFFDMLRYGRESTQVPRIVEDLLSEHGPFGDQSFLDSERGSKLIRILAEIDQGATLKFIEKTISTMSVEDLLNFKFGRRGIINALEIIAITPKYFSRAADMLLRLAEAENESWANNATGIFKELFSNGPGAVAPSGASPAQRLPNLKKALASPSVIIQNIAIEAAKEGLEAGKFSRTAVYNSNELKEGPSLWMPSTYGELYDAYRGVWSAVIEYLPKLSVENQSKATRALIDSVRGLLLSLNIRDEIVDWMFELSELESTNKNDLIKEIVLIQNYDRDKIGSQILNRLEELKNKVVGSGFEALLKRYVGMSIIEDEYDENGNKKEYLDNKLGTLAKEVIKSPKLLNIHINWLISKEPENSLPFGYHLGKLDHQAVFLNEILSAIRSAVSKDVSINFLAGYLQSLQNRDSELWEHTLDSMSVDNKLAPFVPEVTWRSGMSDRAIRRVTDLVKKQVVEITVFGMFNYGSALEPLSREAFEETLEFLLMRSEEEVPSIILNYADFFYGHKQKTKLPEDLGFRIVTQKRLFKEKKKGRRELMDEFYWHRLSTKFVELYPERALDLAKTIIENYGVEGTIIDNYRGDGNKILVQIAKLYPSEIWNMIIPYISPIKDGRGLKLIWWLTGEVSFGDTAGSGAINVFPQQLLWNWVETDVESNAKQLARYIPKEIFLDEDNNSSLARELLVRYGGREDVRKALNNNNFNEGWSGDASAHYLDKQQKLLDLKKSETNQNVINWIEQYIEILSDQIKRSKIEEERDDW